MTTDIQNRIKGLEGILQETNSNLSLLQFMSFDLHKETYNLANNLGLFWIWKSLLEKTIINFYKLMGSDEKFSFIKLFNLARNARLPIDFLILDQKIKRLEKLITKLILTL